MNNWDEIVDILSIYITNDTSEGNYQREIVNCLRMLGWRSKEGTLKEQVTLHIGNNNSIRPDIVLYKDNLPVLPKDFLNISERYTKYTKDKIFGHNC